MAKAHEAEDWDLTPEQHIKRAEQLLGMNPPAGSSIHDDMERSAIAARHAAWALLKNARRAINGRP